MTKPFFFLHLPRTAGTTLNGILRSNFAPEEILNFYTQEDYKNNAERSQESLTGIRLIQGHILLPQFTPPSIFSVTVQPFTFLRSPVERLVSEYNFLRTWDKNHMYAYLRENNITLRDYVLSNNHLLQYRGRNYMTRCISGMDMGLSPYPIKALARAKQHLEHVFCFVGIQERFVESLLLLGDVMGLSTLFYENRNTLKKDEKEPVSGEDIALIKELNRADEALYQFACELFSARVSEKGAGFTQRMNTFIQINTYYQKCSSLLQNEATQPFSESDSPIIFPKTTLW